MGSESDTQILRWLMVVTGTVQGVGYRYMTAKTARKLGLTGMVWNTPERTVQIEVKGPADKLEYLKEWCKQGSPLSLVKTVTVTPISSLSRIDLENSSKPLFVIER